MRASLHAALRLLARWELWVLIGAGVATRFAARWIWDMSGGSDVPFTSATVTRGMFSTVLWSAWLGVSMVLLLPLVRGGRGLDAGFLSRQITTALAGGAIAAGTQFAIPLSFPLWIGSSRLPEWALGAISALVWLIDDLSILLCAWYVHGKGAEAAGKRPPGSWPSAWKGLVTGTLGLWLPGFLLRNLLVAADPHDSYWVPFTYLMVIGAVPLVFGAWFFGALGEGEPKAEPPD